MKDTDLFLKIAKHMELGEPAAAPQRVSGGYLHRMYKLETPCGCHALKLLNPDIMKRPDALENFRRAEGLERVLQEHDIPVISAVEKDGRKMQWVEGQYFYLFPWSEGKAAGWHEIREEHCRIAGRLLARIHKTGIPAAKGSTQEACEADGSCPWRAQTASCHTADIPESSLSAGMSNLTRSSGVSSEETGCREGSFPGVKFTADWAYLTACAERECPEIAGALKENSELLYRAEREYNAALESVPGLVCICDGDMDCKNVLWEDGKPYIIDLESLDYGNPFTEMFQLALSWAGGAVCELDFPRFDGFLEAYLDECVLAEGPLGRHAEEMRRKYCGVRGKSGDSEKVFNDNPSDVSETDVDLRALSGIGFSWLDWLAYNVKRGAGLEGGDEEERRLGIREARETLKRIVYYDSVREKLMKHMEGKRFH